MKNYINLRNTIAIVLFLTVTNFISCSNGNNGTQINKDPTYAAVRLERYIKENMNDPSSYKRIEYEYRKEEDGTTIKMRFRGKNAFGGTIMNTVYGKVDFYGNVIRESVIWNDY